MELLNQVLWPDCLQQHPDTYLYEMLKESKEKIKEQKLGGQYKKPNNEEEALKHKCTELNEGDDVMSNYIEVQDWFKPIRNKPVDYYPLLLEEEPEL